MMFLLMIEVFSRMLKRMEGVGLIMGFKANGVGGDDVCITHLLFVENTILFL